MPASAPQPVAPSGASHRRVPDFFVVGHMKSGTTALYDILRRHPQIYMPHAKEPWFLASEMNIREPPRPPGTGRTPETLEEYLSLFDPALPDQRVGESSALYLWSRTAAARIAELQPAARIIAILREPASFLRSLHLQFVQSYLEPEPDLRRALALEQARREGRQLPRNCYWPGALLYSDHVRYVEQLRRYEGLFPPEQMLVLIYDDFRADNEAVARTVLRFLAVDDAAPPHAADVNPTVRVRWRRAHEMVHAVAVGRGPLARVLNATARKLAPRELTRERAVAIRDRVFFAKPEEPNRALMLELRRRYKDEVVALSDHLGRDLVSLWGYDAIR